MRLNFTAVHISWTRIVTPMPVALLFLFTCFFSGCQMRTPGSFETRFMQVAKRHVTVGGKSDVNPLSDTEENIRAGRANFTSYCMVCHGLDGQNTGVPFAEKMSPPVPTLNSPAVQAYSDGQLHWIIQNGIFPSGMPAAKRMFREDEIWQMVIYIRHLPPKGSSGEAQVYGGRGTPRDASNSK